MNLKVVLISMWFCVPLLVAQTFVISNVSLLPMDSQIILPNHSVIVRDGLIVGLGPSQSIKTPADATVIDGTDRFLIPGLIDMHVHLRDQDDLFLHLAHGVTSVFNLNGRPEHLQWRQAVASGELEGPTIFSTGPTLGGDPPLSSSFKRIDSPQTATQTVAQIAAAGYDAIKIYSGLKPEVYPAIIAQAKAEKIPVVGHIPWAMRVNGVLEAGGLAAVAHAEELFANHISPTSRYMSGDHQFVPGPADEAKIAPLARALASQHVSVIANTWFMDRVLQQAQDHQRVLAQPEFELLSPDAYAGLVLSRYAHRDNHERSKRRSVEMVAFLRKMLPVLNREGVNLLMGSDAPVPGVAPGIGGLQEIIYKVDCGLTPYQALRTATANPYDFFRQYLPKRKGVGLIRIGFRADMILLEGNPFTDIQQLHHRVGVMAQGRWYDDRELQARLNKRKAGFAPFRIAFNRFNHLMRKGAITEAEAFLASPEPALKGRDYAIAFVAYRTASRFLERDTDADAAIAARAAVLADRYLPDETDILTLLARARARHGEVGLAIRAYERVLALDADHQGARNAIERLKSDH